MRKNKKPFFENITITDIGAEGKAISKVEGKVIFIPYGIPGDKVDVQVTSSRKKYYEGYITKFRKKADQRTLPFCNHFEICGGCKWQHLPYQEQLFYKQKQVVDNIERIGQISGFKVNNIIPSEDIQFYRNKLEFTFSNNRWLTEEEIKSGVQYKDKTALGFHIPKKFDKVLDIEKCYLQKSPSNEIRLSIKEFARNNHFSFFNIIKQEGFLRNLIIRTSLTGEVMVIVSFFYDDTQKRINILDHIKMSFPGIKSLMYVINQKPNETLYDQDIQLYDGRDYILEQLDDLKFKIGPKSFYQTNSKQIENLYSTVLKMARLKKNEIVYDLYSGTGTIAIYLARKCKKIIGIETVPESVEDARVNASMNSIINASFFEGDVKDLLNKSFIEKNKSPDTIILDPPRSGLHSTVIKKIIALKVKKIIYVSCNPATQARDLSLLKDRYFIKEIQPIDMFPHTHHVENVASLALK